ncbi:MAG: hypothetical protein Q8R43_01860 [Alphaproteobacteria bacterium]|nr:hypothetical protein [Alphaproteobacteria bacterium]
MRLLLTPVHIASVCLSLVNGAEFLDGSNDEQGFGMERSQTECFGNDEDEGGMGERTDSESYYVESDVASSAAEPGGEAFKLVADLAAKQRLDDIRSGAFKGEGKFSCAYVGGVVPKVPDAVSLLRESRHNNLILLKHEGDKAVSEHPEPSTPGSPKVSTEGANTPDTPRPSSLKRTTSMKDMLADL